MKLLAGAWSWIKAKEIPQDLMFFVGFAALLRGIELVNRPAAYIIGGVLVMLFAYFSTRK